MRQTGVLGLIIGLVTTSLLTAQDANTELFTQRIVPLFSRHCLACHNHLNSEGGFSLETRAEFLLGGDSGPVFSPENPLNSYLLSMVSGTEPAMPQGKPPLSADEQQSLREWITRGAPWPADQVIPEPAVEDLNWWSLRPLSRPALPDVPEPFRSWPINAIDRFVVDALASQGLTPSPSADRRTLIRRLYLDLIGLPPDFATIERFVHDPAPDAYERLVDQLLDSPHYGERWARHWLDVVHYGDTHGYDKDQPRPHAWPYRDYVIRSFNQDKPYSRFVLEQLAGDALWPHTRDGVEATGFIAAGPWDLIGHAEVPESKIDGQIARNLDRDDMVSSTMNTFVSLTAQCARCHNHKFDPVTQEHYYSLQSVFAALDRTDREYDVDEQIAAKRLELQQRSQTLSAEATQIEQAIREAGGAALAELDAALVAGDKASQHDHPAYGYHSQIAPLPDAVKWVQVDLGDQVEHVQTVILNACQDNYANIGAGFGFPRRFRVEASAEPDFRGPLQIAADFTEMEFRNPRLQPVTIELPQPIQARYWRITATQLAERSGDFIFALAEFQLLDADGDNLARQRTITAFDSIEMPPRWQQTNLVDGIYPQHRDPAAVAMDIEQIKKKRDRLLAEKVDSALLARQRSVIAELQAITAQAQALPAPSKVYCGAIHTGSGAFLGTGGKAGRPREIRILHRGDVQSPGALVSPGTVPIIVDVPWQFALPETHREHDRRIALAQWIVRDDNPLTWRSIVNRVWLYHFGRGIVDSPNDFGRMGELPTHPELLDWLAIEFRDGGQSLKDLHRLMVTSRTYRQVSTQRPECAAVDGDNRFYWRMNRRLLDAEAIRDSLLLVSGQLNLTLYGPPFRDFVLERPEHSPHYEYHLADPQDPATHRRSIYRFLVRSQQQPFMQTLDCADPSESVPKRTTTLTALQALTLLNNRLVITLAEKFAERAEQRFAERSEQVALMWREAIGREPTEVELGELVELSEQIGLAHVARLIFNLNEFVFVD